MESEITTIKQAIKELQEFMEGKNPPHVQDARQFGLYVVKVLEGLSYKVEELERQIGPSSAFIDINDIPNRLR